jgi:ectoine hydroxylase-related dioxygenase (phytanoyl-CoA dioxygenase family)
VTLPARPSGTALRLDPEGAELFPAAFAPAQLEMLDRVLAAIPPDAPGIRLAPLAGVAAAIGPATEVARSILGPAARPVRATSFDKSPGRNWALGWHQDRTIAVRARIETPGFTRWTRKAGIVHVAPPFELLARMLTLRIHLDPAGLDNAPLLVVPGSHRRGIIAECDVQAVAARGPQAACLAERGDLWVYAAPILHASARAARPGKRRVLQLMYSAEELPNGLSWLGV